MTPDSRAEGFVAGTRKIVQILRYGPRGLALALLGFLLLGAIPLLPKLGELLPFLTPALPWITGVLVVLGLFLLGLAAWRIWKKVVAPLPEAKPKPAAIKGPAPFGPQDAELFARLGRNDDLNRLRDWILDDQKPLVALMGESGVGKTSLLRAGLAYHLQEDKVPVLYWEAVPTEPEAKLLHAVQELWEEKQKAPNTFDGLASSVASGRRVVVIDQAEQLSPEGHPRIFKLLRQVAEGDPPYQATWVVAFRREFLPVWRDFELSLPEPVQRRMETLSLQRFSPKAAEKVIAVLAEEGSLPVDQKLVEKLVESVAVEGNVSPADVGISLLVLSELAGKRPDASLSLDDFRESGGQSGLLTRYLERLLELFPEAERPEVLRGLLALVDLEKDQRMAEGRTAAELEEAVKPSSPPRFAAALRFLASSKARVLEELPGEPVRYRLVHERLIPAIRKLTGVLLAEAERAGLALERGYRVWAQDRQSRFLLHRKDLEEVRRFKDQIRWGKEEADKREFVRLSRRRETWRKLAVVAAGVAAVSVVLGIGEFTRKREYQSLLATWGLPPDLYDHLGRLEELTLPGTVTRLDWLRNAKRLKTLTIEDGVLESLEGVPAGLKTLAVGKSRLSDLTGLPSGLISLRLGANQFARLSVLPAGLRSLDILIDGPQVEALGDLPRSLESLKLMTYEELEPFDLRGYAQLHSLALSCITCESAQFTFQSHLPAGLRSLELEGYEFPGAKDLPRGLQSLSIRGRSTMLRDLPPALKILELRFPFNTGDVTIDASHLRNLRSLSVTMLSHEQGVQLSILPERLESLKVTANWVALSGPLTQNLKVLQLWVRRIRSRRSDFRLPAGLESLGLSWSPPPNLPESLRRLEVPDVQGVRLPARLESLDLSNSINFYGPIAKRLKLPKVPDGLIELNVSNSPVMEMPPNLRKLTTLNISFSLIDSLKNLPPSLKTLSLGNRQVKTLEGLPKSATALHFHESPIHESPSLRPW